MNNLDNKIALIYYIKVAVKDSVTNQWLIYSNVMF